MVKYWSIAYCHYITNELKRQGLTGPKVLAPLRVSRCTAGTTTWPMGYYVDSLWEEP